MRRFSLPLPTECVRGIVCEIARTNHGEHILILGKSWLVSRRRARRPLLPLYFSTPKATLSVYRTTPYSDTVDWFKGMAEWPKWPGLGLSRVIGPYYFAHKSLRYDSPLCIPPIVLRESGGHTRALYFIRCRSKIDEGCSDTRLAAEPVPRVNGDRLMMPLAHQIFTMGKDMAIPASLGDYQHAIILE